MPAPTYKTAFIVGAGPGLSASLARRFAREGLKVAIAARDTEKLEALAKETGALTIAADISKASDVTKMFRTVDEKLGVPDAVVFNAGPRLARGPFVQLDLKASEDTIQISALGGFYVAQEAIKRMLPNRHGALLFTGASASVKGYARSAPFAMGKFALRGLAQSLARELSPQGIHVAHFIIDGDIRSEILKEADGAPDSLLSPDAIADTYWHVMTQDRSAWTWEVELRPWVETF